MEGLSYAYCVTGWPSGLKPRLVRKVGALSRHGGFHQKVGITGNPEIRWSQHKPNGWKRMDVIYQSTSRFAVEQVECYLAGHFRMGLCTSAGYHHNRVGGGGGRKPDAAPLHYVYVLSAPAYTRLTT